MTFNLDCESGISAIKTLCFGFSCKEDSLKDALLSIDIEKIYEENPRLYIPSEEYLYNYVVGKFGTHKPLSLVYWFHLTRTIKGNEFKDGIYPLGEVLKLIWEIMLSVPKDEKIVENLIVMKNEGVNDSLYGMKAINSMYWGPYAVLVKDVAFHSKRLSQHNYLKLPEIVEDICNGYKKQFGLSIYKIYDDALVPKVVKFRSSNRLDEGCIKAAIYYIYRCVRNTPPCGGAVTCIDNSGVNIHPQDIVSVSEISPNDLINSDN